MAGPSNRRPVLKLSRRLLDMSRLVLWAIGGLPTISPRRHEELNYSRSRAMHVPVKPPGERRPHLAMRAVLVAFVAAATMLAWPWFIERQQRRFAEQLAGHAVASTSAAPSIRELQSLGRPATAPLLRLATLPRVEVAVAAQNALANQLVAWEIEFFNTGDVTTFAEQLGALSAGLETHAGQLDAAGRHWAQKLARRIVGLADRLGADEAWTVLAACESVLSLPTPPRAAEARLATVYDAPVVAPVTPNVSPDRQTLEQAIASQVSIVRADVLNQRDLDSSAPLADLSVIISPTQMVPPSGPPGATATVNPLLNTLRPAADMAAESAVAGSLAEALSSIVDVPSPLEMRHIKRRLRTLTDQELIATSDTASRFEASAARQILRSRGYSDELLRQTRQLQQLPAADRRAALDRASALPAAEARRLLRWFVTDADADVRLHALTLLATTGDPQLSEIARQRAVDDADPRVAELATRLMKQ